MRFFSLCLVLCVACGDDSSFLDAGTDARGPDAPELDATGPDAPGCGAEQTFEDVQVPMRDDAMLAAFIRRPTDPDCRLPTVLIQTPYNKETARALWFEADGPNPLFDSTDYAFVVVDWRGRFGSSDAESDPMLQDEDGYDTVEWIADQSWSDGTVGTFGPSALCRVQYRTAEAQPPALRAAVPIFCPRREEYEQYYPGGVLRREYLQSLGLLFGTVTTLLEMHPTHDALWRSIENMTDPAARIQVPMMLVAGWWDLSPAIQLADFAALRARSPAGDDHRLLIGPWSHFATNAESEGIGRDYTAEERMYFDNAQQMQIDTLAFFDLHLRGLESAAATWPVVRWTTGASGVAESGDVWPPTDTSAVEYYLGSGGTLDTGEPDGPPIDVDFPYDPADPSPTIGGMALRFDLLHGPTDQADVIAREDARTFETAPVSEPLRIRGRIVANLRVKTTGADTDFAVRIADIQPDGTWIWIGEGIRRLSLRDDFATRSEVVATTAYDVPVELANHLAYDLPVGHALGLIVTSSNFPRFDVNPNDGSDFLEAGGGMAVTNTVVTDGVSRLTIPLAP